MSANQAKLFLCKTLDPNNPGGPKIDAVFPADFILRYYKYYPVRYLNLIAAKYVLDNVKRIFTGIREFDENGWCYTGRPDEWYVKEDTKQPFPNEFVFAVYLRWNMRVFECGAEYASEKDPMSPKGWEDRYGGRIWKITS